MVSKSTALGVLAIALLLTGAAAFIARQFAIAGICFLGISMTLYYRGVSS